MPTQTSLTPKKETTTEIIIEYLLNLIIYNKIIIMLPLSTGRSPKIDSFYQSMRSIHHSSASNYASD